MENIIQNYCPHLVSFYDISNDNPLKSSEAYVDIDLGQHSLR